MRKLIVVTLLLLPALALGAQTWQAPRALPIPTQPCNPPRQCRPVWRPDVSGMQRPERARRPDRRGCMDPGMMVVIPVAMGAVGSVVGVVATMALGLGTHKPQDFSRLMTAGALGGFTLGAAAIATSGGCPHRPREP